MHVGLRSQVCLRWDSCCRRLVLTEPYGAWFLLLLLLLLAAAAAVLRLADVAFEAQDEAARLREQLQEIQERQRLNGDGDGRSSAPAGGEAPASESITGAAAAAAGGGDAKEGAVDGEAEVGSIDDVDRQRAAELEAANRATEEGKRAAEEEARRAREEARQAKAALDEAQTKVRVGLSVSARTRWLLALPLAPPHARSGDFLLSSCSARSGHVSAVPDCGLRSVKASRSAF